MTRILLLLILVVLPLVEIAGFALVGAEIGVLATIALVIASTILGSALLRLQGIGALSSIRRDIEAGRDPGRELAHGAIILVAGILLIIPGFFTDIVGILLFLPPVRRLAWRIVRRRLGAVSGFTVGRRRFPSGHPSRSRTIDLDEEDYSRTRDPESPWRRIDDRG